MTDYKFLSLNSSFISSSTRENVMRLRTKQTTSFKDNNVRETAE